MACISRFIGSPSLFIQNLHRHLRVASVPFICAPELIVEGDTTPTEVVLKYPNGIEDYLKVLTEKTSLLTPRYFTGKADLAEDKLEAQRAIRRL